MDEREREKFYSSTADDEGPDEYELEPPDPEVLAAEERRAQETIAATHSAIDIDEIYRDADHDRGREIMEGWVRDFRFQFQVKHLLIATAVLAIVLTLIKLHVFGTVLVLLSMMSVIGLYSYLQLQERKQQQEADRRRQEMYERRRAFLEGKLRVEPQNTMPVSKAENASAAAVDLVAGEIIVAEKPRPHFRLQFSLRQLMAAMTVAAVFLAIVHLLGASSAATLLGLLALGGLVVHAVGFEPPAIIVLGWWLILVLYVLLSIFNAIWYALS